MHWRTFYISSEIDMGKRLILLVPVMYGPTENITPSGLPTSVILATFLGVSLNRGEANTAALPSSALSKITSVQGSSQRGYSK